MNYKRSIFVLFFSLLSLPLLALGKSYDVEVDGIFYVLNKDANEASVVMGSDEIVGTGNYETWKRVASYRGDVVIPESFVYNNIEYTVTSIKTLRNWIGSMMGDWEYYHAFENCVELTSITIPKSIKRIDSNSFYGCTSLESVYISDLSAWCRIDFDEWYPYGGSSNPLRFAHDLYINGSKVTELVIPEDINVINEYTFIGGSFTSLILHKNIEEIKWIAFDECNNLRDIYFYGTILKYTTYDEMTSLGDEELTWHIREKYHNNIYCFGAKHIEYIEGIDPKLIYYVDGLFYKKIFPDPGETIIPEPDPSKDGYSFSGWIGLTETMQDNDVIVNGFFSPNTYKLTYIVNAVGYKEVEIKYNEVIIPEPYPVKKGMTFSGWSVIPEKMPANNIEVTGSFNWSKTTLDNVYYQVNDTISNSVLVIGCNNVSGEVKIVPTIEFDDIYTVTTINDKAFNGNKNIEKIEICKNITSIGERAFANIDKLTDVTIYAENVPETDRTAFENSYIDYVTLHVPYGSLDAYKSTAPWSGFKEIVPIEGTEPVYVETCAMPTISFVDGKLVFESETDGAECHYEIKVEDAKDGVGAEVALSSTYEITVYASKEGYNDSEKNTATLYWVNVDPISNSVIDIEIKVNTNVILVQNDGGLIAISGIADGNNVMIYNTSGQLIAQGTASGNSVEIDTNLSTGDVCIIKIGDRSVKFMLK